VSEVETGAADAVVRRLERVVERGRAAAPAGVGAQPAGGDGTVGGDGVATRPAGLGAFDPGRPGLRALVAVVVVVALGAAALAWLSRPRPEPVAAVLTAPHPTAAMPGGPVAVASPTGPVYLVVAVTGTVRRPGLVRVPPGARVADVIEAAGGLVGDGDLGYLNLARRVADGELIAVGTPAPPAGDAGPGPGAAGPGLPGAGRPVNLNTATTGELEALPGVGPVLAQRIVAHREQHGGFRSVEDLRQVSGIGEARFAELRDLVTV
jgi:competence protein ComEA